MVAFVNETVFAFVIAPVVDINSTFGTVTKFVPDIVTFVAELVIVDGETPDIVGFVVVD